MRKSRIVNPMCPSSTTFIMFMLKLSTKSPTFLRADQPGATSKVQRQRLSSSTCEVTTTKIRLVHTTQTPSHISSKWQTGTSNHTHTHILPVRASLTLRENSWSLLISVIFIIVFCAVAWFASPKGENQTYVLVLSSLLLARDHKPIIHESLVIALALRRQPTNTTRSQCLALDAHPLCLELLAHVGYVLLLLPPSPTRFGHGMCGLLTTWCFFLVAITFLAQWHPLIAPERADLRPEYNGGPVASNGMF